MKVKPRASLRLFGKKSDEQKAQEKTANAAKKAAKAQRKAAKKGLID